MNKTPLLLVLSRFPYPPIGGDKLKSYHLIKILSKHFDIHAVCIAQAPLGKDEIAFCKTYFTHYKIFYKTKTQHIFATLKAIFSPLPLQVHYYYFKDIAAYIQEIAPNYPILFNTLIRTSPYIQPLKHSSIKVLDMVDSIALNYENSKQKTKSIFYKIFYSIETKRLKKYEKKCVSSYDLSLFVNHLEASFYKQYGAVKALPNGVDSELLKPREKIKKYKNFIAFCGKMDYQPNIDAIIWFISKVMPLLYQDISLLIVGANPTKEIINKANKRIHITGYLDDIHTPIYSCFGVVAPMQTGGGIQNKILEAMALGQIVITTTLGAKPIAKAKDKEHFLVFDEAHLMAECINNIFQNPNTYDHIRHNAQNLIKTTYLWENYENALINEINKLLTGGGA